MLTLGLNGRPVAYHDASACLLAADGHVLACAEEERFSRVKHGLGIPPRHSARFCLSAAGVAAEDIDVVAIGWDVPRLRRSFGRRWDDDSGADLLRALVGPELAARMRRARLEFVPHHLAHAATAFWASGFPAAAVLVVDGQGEDTSISILRADRDTGPRLLRSWSPRYSLGWLYEEATSWLGFGFLEAGKTMALASFHGGTGDSTGDGTRDGTGDPGPLITVHGDELLLDPGLCSDAAEDIAGFWQQTFTQLAGRAGPTTAPAALCADPAAVLVAGTAQRTVQHILAELARMARTATGIEALCVAGGVALNCVANGLLDEPVYIPPVPHDGGVALGAAWTIVPPASAGQLRPDLGFDIPAQPGPTLVRQLLGSGGEQAAVPAAGAVRIHDLELSEVVDRLAAGQIGAIAEGRAEIGPRALGRRSIIALPRPADVADRLNRLKGREPWRPFGPAALEGPSDRWWQQRAHLARYMLGAVPLTDAGTACAPAVRHVDGTTRPQLVRPDETSVLREVLIAMAAAGIPPVLVNTSFNFQGKPIVNSPRHAIEDFLAMDLQFLVLGDLLITKPPRDGGDREPRQKNVVSQ